MKGKDGLMFLFVWLFRDDKVTKLQRKVQQLQEELNHMFRYMEGQKKTLAYVVIVRRALAPCSIVGQGLVPRVYTWVVSFLDLAA